MSPKITSDSAIPQNTILRRYMDLPKLLDLLHTRSLYFRRADGFSDRLEGALFPGFRKSLDEMYERRESPYNADDFYQRSRVGSYVSCWTIGAQDNMALWQLYGGVKTSIVVTSTVSRIIECAFFWNRNTELEKVKYVDHRRVKNYIMGTYTDVLKYKSDAYKYEKEFRVIIPQQGEGWEANAISLRLPLESIDSLIRSIVVAPEADSDFLEAIRELCKRYGVSAPVRRSKLALVSV